MKKNKPIVRKILILMFAVMSAVSMYAQQEIRGTIYEEVNGEKQALPFANIFIPGTTRGATSDFDGKYSVTVYDNDTLIKVSYMGYTDVLKSFHIGQGELVVDVVMSSSEAALQLNAVTVTAKKNLANENMLLLEQKKAVMAVEAVGAKELAVKGVSDAAAAVTKVTGISKQEGNGSLNVRGLGDRYNTTTLNRLPLPSNNAEVKNIDLSLFTTDVLSFIKIEKNYAANLYGDFAGANVDVVSKKHTGNAYLKVALKGSQNSSLLGLDDFYTTDGPSSLGFYTPADIDIAALEQRSIYDFETSWNPTSKTVLPNLGLSVEGGKAWDFDDDSELSVFATLSFDNEKSYTEKLENVVSATGLYLDSLEGNAYDYNTQTNAMLNVAYDRASSTYQFNSMLLNSSEQEYTKLKGTIRDVNDQGNGLKVRGQFEQNMLWVNQLLGHYDLANAWSASWALAYNYVRNVVPDRMQNTYLEYDDETNLGEFDTETTGRNYRYSHTFTDDEYAANFDIEKLFGYDQSDESYRSKLTLGTSGKYKIRDFYNYQLNHGVKVVDGVRPQANIYDVDAYLNFDNYKLERFDVLTPKAADDDGVAQYGEGYQGRAVVAGGYVFYEHHISDKLLVLLGTRGEHVYQEMRTRSRQNTSGRTEEVAFDEFKILPSLTARYSLNEQQNLRFSASKTYTLPQLQEMPLIAFSGISDVNYGNPYLTPSDVYNADLKWEFFPKYGELLSLTAFGKYIVDPINRFTVAGTQNEYVSANTGDWAYVYGLELDFKKDLYKVEDKKVFMSANLSLMDSKTVLDAQRIREETEGFFNANFNDDYSKLQGAAPVLANVALGYTQRWKDMRNTVSSVFIYNYVSDRLYAIGQSGRGHEFDQAINTLDYVLKFKFDQLGLDFKAQNLLNPSYSRVQKNRNEQNADYVVRSYQKGVNVSLTLNYRF